MFYKMIISSALILILTVACGGAAAPAATPVPAATLAPAQPPAPTAAPTALPPTAQPTTAQPTAAANPTAATNPTAAPSVGGGFVQLGASLNRDKSAAGTDQALTVGSLQSGNPGVAWVTWAEKTGNSQQIFVGKQTGSAFDPVGASLNIHGNVVAEHPSIDFAGTDRTVPWVAWYEPSPGFNNVKQIFASRFNATTGLWTPAGKDRGDNEPSLNIHTNATAEDPDVVGGTANTANPSVPWVCWQESSAYHNAVEIFVSRAVKDDNALGGFHWQPVGLNRGGAANDPEPSLNVDFAHGQSSSCGIIFAGVDNTVPWVTWAEKTGSKPSQIFVAKAISDTTPNAGGFKWQFVPNCTSATATQCSLNVNPLRDGTEPFITAGTVTPGQPTSPWIVWTEVGPSGKTQVFVERLDPESKNAFLNVGGSLNVDQGHNASAASMTFVGNVPYVAWQEEVGGTTRVFIRHLASDPQTGTWVLDTTKDGLAVDPTKGATGPLVRGTADGKLVLVWLEGNPDKEAAQVVACTNATLANLFQRLPGLAAPFLATQHCGT